MTKIVLWVSDLNAQADFYAKLFAVSAPTVGDGFAEVSDGTNAVLLHTLPAQYAAPTPLTSQLPAQEAVAIKPVFTVASIADAADRMAGTLATVYPTSVTYGEFTYRDVVDPEGNVIQLQQRN